MTTSAEAERQDWSKCRQSEGEAESENRNNQATKTFVGKLRRSLQYGTFKQVNHLIVKILIIIMYHYHIKWPGSASDHCRSGRRWWG